MTESASTTQCLLSLPPAMTGAFALLPGVARDCLAVSDPAETKLGSGGGTAHTLAEAWRQTGDGATFGDWLRASRKLIVHGGGQSRRLPAYAAVGKPFIPIPVFRWAYGQRLDQTLLDFQRPAFERILEQAAASGRVLVTSGDVLLRFGALPDPLPDADVVAFGMTVEPEVASHFGVFFARRDVPKVGQTFWASPERTSKE